MIFRCRINLTLADAVDTIELLFHDFRNFLINLDLKERRLNRLNYFSDTESISFKCFYEFAWSCYKNMLIIFGQEKSLLSAVAERIVSSTCDREQVEYLVFINMLFAALSMHWLIRDWVDPLCILESHLINNIIDYHLTWALIAAKPI